MSRSRATTGRSQRDLGRERRRRKAPPRRLNDRISYSRVKRTRVTKIAIRNPPFGCFWRNRGRPHRPSGSNLDDLPLQTLGDGFGARGGAELLEQRFDMELDGVRRDAEAAGRLFFSQPVALGPKNLDFSG